MAVTLACLLFAGSASAHGMRSIYVEVVELSPGQARVTTRAQVPVTGITITADAPCTLDGEMLVCPGTLGGATLHVEGLGPIVSEAVVWVSAEGTSTSHLVTPQAPSWTLPSTHVSSLEVARDYVGLGVRHIATGADHLLFLLALVLALKRVRAVLLAETAFTLSHSLSFSASALGWIHVSAAAAEACIALSLVLVALDIGRGETTARRGAALAFVFGLVHGLGFAGGLAEIGMPPSAIPAALVGFAGGVEIGQIAFLAVALTLFALAQRTRVGRLAPTVGAYAVGVVGCFWLFERIRAFT
jgi:hypothetical protein